MEYQQRPMMFGSEFLPYHLGHGYDFLLLDPVEETENGAMGVSWNVSNFSQAKNGEPTEPRC
jgi:hypothetical protein